MYRYCKTTCTLTTPNHIPFFLNTNLFFSKAKTALHHHKLSLMATTFTILKPTLVRASAISPGNSDPNNRKAGSTNWWAPLFGMSTEPDYINGRSSLQGSDPERPRSKFGPGCFTEEKARQLRRKTFETSTFHDIMYHSAIASRLASDVSQGSPIGMRGAKVQITRSMLADLALAAMDELTIMAQENSPLWIKRSEDGKEVLNHEEYARVDSPFVVPEINGYVTDASREIGMLTINSESLVETLMDEDRWSKMFPTIIANATTLDILSSGFGGTRNGAMKLMHAEIQLLSPLVPVRGLCFLRFCKKHAEGVWVVVDVSVDYGHPLHNCIRLPSGCVMQDTPNGFCKLTWVDHSKYDESVVHQLYRPLVSSGIGFGAQRWVTALQRQCERFAILKSRSLLSEDPTGISLAGKRSLSKLAQRMTNCFWSGVCSSSFCNWNMLHINNMVNNDLKIMVRNHMDGPGESLGIVLCATTSVWLSVSRQRVFEFLTEVGLRGKWDVLHNGESMQEILHLAKGQGPKNCISILRSNSAANGTKSNVLYLQDSWTDSTGSMVVYAPISMQTFNRVMTGRASTYVAILPCGFAILPDGNSNNNGNSRDVGVNIQGDVGDSNSFDNTKSDGNGGDNGGCLLTIGLQILLKNLPTAKLTEKSVNAINELLSSTIYNIKHALEVA